MAAVLLPKALRHQGTSSDPVLVTAPSAAENTRNQLSASPPPTSTFDKPKRILLFLHHPDNIPITKPTTNIIMLFKSAFTLSALLMLASALSVEPSSFSLTASSCEKEDEADCKEFCGLSEQTATCSANGNKITCSCKGGKTPESNCEERCLLCMPGKSALEEAKAYFKL
ncbi:hypothetical protein PZA11_005523 [Diplocarpon coronariae]